MIKVDNLSKSFGKHEVLKNISTQIEEGEVVAVIGLPVPVNQRFCAA